MQTMDTGWQWCVIVGSSVLTNVPLLSRRLTVGEASGEVGIRQISLPSIQFCYEPKIALKSKVYWKWGGWGVETRQRKRDRKPEMFSTRLFQAKGQGQGRKKTLSYPLQMEVCLTRQSGLKNKAQNSGKLHLREFSKFLALNTASHVLLVVRAVKKKNTLLFVALNSIFDTVFLRSTRFPKRSVLPEQNCMLLMT